MNYKELYDQVLHLGFETTALESDAIYADAVNRAIYQVNSIRPRIDYKDILHYPQQNMLGSRYTDLSDCYKGSVEFPVSGCREFIISLSGNYEIYIVDKYGGKQTLTLTTTMPVVGMNRLRVSLGENAESVCIQTQTRFIYENAGAYLIQNDSNVDPGTRFTRYTVNNAISLSSNPIVEANGYQYITTGYQVEGNVILLDNSLKGLYRIAYLPKLEQITANTVKGEGNIPLDDDLCALLPLVIASYVWLDDDPDRADYYYGRYQEQAQLILRRGRAQAPIKYDTNGW